jgi:dUTP pyrophosphatase
MKIKVRSINHKPLSLETLGEEAVPFNFIEKGEWIDLRSSIGVKAKKQQDKVCYSMIPLGIAMQLPKGYEAIVAPRSSTFKKYGIIMANSIGIIDSSYCGNDDEWQFPALFTRDAKVGFNDRICQFRIQLSQKATVLQKLKWLFTSKIKFVWVSNLANDNRGGFGSTGTK